MPRRFRKYKKNNLKKYIKSALAKQIETSSVVTLYTGQTVQDNGRTPVDSSLATIAQGTDEAQRVKNQVHITGIRGDMFITGSDSTNAIRVILYIPKDANYSMNNESPKLPFNGAVDLDKFTVLKDFFVCTSSTGANCKRLRIRKRFSGNGVRVQYSGPSGGTFTKNPIYLYMVSDSLAVGDPTVNGYVRLYYKDG